MGSRKVAAIHSMVLNCVKWWGAGEGDVESGQGHAAAARPGAGVRRSEDGPGGLDGLDAGHQRAFPGTVNFRTGAPPPPPCTSSSGSAFVSGARGPWPGPLVALCGRAPPHSGDSLRGQAAMPSRGLCYPHFYIFPGDSAVPKFPGKMPPGPPADGLRSPSSSRVCPPRSEPLSLSTTLPCPREGCS